jgi:hypothetical protein
MQDAMVQSMQAQGRRDAEAVASSAGYNNGGGHGRRGGDEMGVPPMAQQGPSGGLETGYGGRTMRNERPVSSLAVSPMEKGDDIGYRRRG